MRKARKADDQLVNAVKKPRSVTSVQKQIAALQLYESKIKFAMICPSPTLLPAALFDKFSDLNSSLYTAITEWEPDQVLDVDHTSESITIALNHCQSKQLLGVHFASRSLFQRHGCKRRSFHHQEWYLRGRFERKNGHANQSTWRELEWAQNNVWKIRSHCNRWL